MQREYTRVKHNIVMFKPCAAQWGRRCQIATEYMNKKQQDIERGLLMVLQVRVHPLKLKRVREAMWSEHSVDTQRMFQDELPALLAPRGKRSCLVRMCV